MNQDGWITLDAYCEKYDERKNTVLKRVHAGAWPRGEMYSCPGGGAGFVHEARAAAWLKSKGKLKG